MSRNKSSEKNCLIQRIDMGSGEPVNEWAVIASGKVAGWVVDSASATAMTHSDAVKFQVANERRPQADWVACRLDDLTLAGPNAAIEIVSDDYSGVRGRGDY